jgi:hypothetical protein
MSWKDSVDRVLVMRELEALRRKNRDLVRILLEVEERCQVVVKRDISPALQGLPSWKDKRKTAKLRARSWREFAARKEAEMSTETDKRYRREQEISDVLQGKLPGVPMHEKGDSQ